MIVPPALVLRSDEGNWKSVVEPMFDMEKSVEVAPLLVVDEMVKSVWFTEVDAAWSERSANGEVVPRPRFPVAELNTSGDCPRSPKRTVDDARNPAVSKSGVLVEFTVTPKFDVVVNGNPKFW